MVQWPRTLARQHKYLWLSVFPDFRKANKFAAFTELPKAKRVSRFRGLRPVAVLARKIWGHGPMASAVARVYNEGLRADLPPARSRDRAPGQRVRGSEGLKLKHFWFLDVRWKPQICSVF